VHKVTCETTTTFNNKMGTVTGQINELETNSKKKNT